MSGQITGLQQDLLSELVRGVELPLLALDPIHIEVLLELLQKAYEGVKADYPPTVSGGDEKDINTLMVERLDHLIRDDPVAGLMIRGVSRGSEMINFNAKHIEKRPDIQISLTSRRHVFPLIVECKIIDGKNGKTISLYCQKGLARFIAGDYAWTDREAIMLAYVRDGSSAANHLYTYLDAAMASSPPEFAVVALPQQCFSSLPDATRSEHERAFSYVHDSQKGESPGGITVWHLWVQ